MRGAVIKNHFEAVILARFPLNMLPKVAAKHWITDLDKPDSDKAGDPAWLSPSCSTGHSHLDGLLPAGIS